MEQARGAGRWLLRKKWWVIAVCGAFAALVIAPSIYTNAATASKRFTAQNVPKNQVAIVFGAGVLPDGTPTPYLKVRLQTAAALYKTGSVKKLLLTGDNSTSHHNEPVAMRKYVEGLGVPARAITLDYAGFNTYDSCYRARHIFGVTKATLVSHGYHLPRAITTCQGLGIASVGVPADTGKGRQYSVNYLFRELVSTDKAILQLHFKPQPTVLGKPESPLE